MPKDVLEEEEEPGTKGNVPPPTSDHKTNWLDAIKANADPICPAEIGHRTSSVCQLGNIGYRLKRKLTWDPVTELFVGDDAANKELVREPRGKWKI